MRIYFYELSEEPKHLHFTQQDAWVSAAVKAAQEEELVEKPNYSVDFDIHKSQDLVFMKGKFNVQVTLLCSRCAKTFSLPLRSQFESLFTRQEDFENPGGSHNHGIAYSGPTGSTGEEMDIQCLEKDYIELEDVLKEQIYLGLPFQPLCQEDCKGICPVCGQDRNTHPCQCHRIKNTALANALKNIKIS